SAQIREILISESAWEEMTCLFAPSLGYWRTHDFRRTLVTRLSEMNVEPHVTERMLGHELGGIMSVYNKHDWIEAQRKAYELHADKLFWHIRSISD
ncbi:hypothetical protein ACQ9AQ_18950, partial [Escherichia coli]|nr:hypothetical protein [Escherichia coli]